MRKVLPVLLLIVATYYLNPIYPIYAQNSVPSRENDRQIELKQKIAKFKDKNKASLVEKISLDLNKINQKRSEAAFAQLNAILQNLTKTEDQVNIMASNGIDVNRARAGISQARMEIQKAQQTYNKQKNSDYTIPVSSEQNVLADAKAMRDKLFADQKELLRYMKTAKSSVLEANAIALALVR